MMCKGEKDMKQFIYVFSDGDRDKLLASGAALVRNDEKNKIFVFVNEPNKLTFALTDISYIESDSITL